MLDRLRVILASLHSSSAIAECFWRPYTFGFRARSTVCCTFPQGAFDILLCFARLPHAPTRWKTDVLYLCTRAKHRHPYLGGPIPIFQCSGIPRFQILQLITHSHSLYLSVTTLFNLTLHPPKNKKEKAKPNRTKPNQTKRKEKKRKRKRKRKKTIRSHFHRRKNPPN